jgi:hypothetical protein
MISVYDNVLDIELLDTLRSEVLGSNTPWFYVPNSAYEDTAEDLKQGSLFHLAIDPEVPPSTLANICLEVADQCLKHMDVASYTLFRARLALQMWKGSEPITHGGHVDCEVPHIVGLLYISDSDGDTVIYDQEHPMNTVSKEPDILTEQIRISPKSNRLVIFDGYHFHSSSAPTEHATRYVINFNWHKIPK